MSSRKKFRPHIMRLDSTVGECGNNKPEEVLWFQQTLSESGYQELTGRDVKITGKCDKDTIDGIRWFQNMLSMKPTGMIHPGDIWLPEAINNVVLQPWRKTVGAIQVSVPEGQVTFDAEGNDYVFPDYAPKKAPKKTGFFSRILHWPGEVSGVTLGRGYDMKMRTAGEIFSTLRSIGIEEYRAVIASNAAYLSGRQAKLFVETTWQLFGEISYAQQIELFKRSYLEKKNYAKYFYVKTATTKPNAPSWDDLDQKIKDVLVDIFYQGTRYPASLVEAALAGRTALIKFIREDPALMRYEPSRQRIRYLQ
ncbi:MULTISPECIES: peptidoglycan-binding protein [unclassified Cronobacter]|uniref:peptidoglycan-binding protein n=1 Tax=unclassified Cronobacter TaxID=2649764 RepID=UPI00210541C3|nr:MULTISPECIES: peptidoglycan-binding protein [unclassified Cronobacter]